MSTTTPSLESVDKSASKAQGAVVSLWRYPVKSMMGEEINATYVTERGLFGDRAFALMDTSDGKVASAKNPRKWPTLFYFRAAYMEPPLPAQAVPAVRITLPNGETVTNQQSNLDTFLSEELGRPVAFQTTPPAQPSLEEYWPDIEGLAHREHVTDEATLAGTFFDLAIVHILTTATLDRLRELYPSGRFEAKRFRPNIVITPEAGLTGFVENSWIGQTLALGDEVLLEVTGPCPRCVMTTLPQGDLPKDPGVLRTAVQHNEANVGVYARVIRNGTVRRGDTVRLV